LDAYLCRVYKNNIPKLKMKFMASKKFSVLAAGILSLCSIGTAVAQSGSVPVYRGAGYDVLDTALIPESRMGQQRDFLNRTFDYPAKPRNQWELGVSVGPLNVSGDVRSKNFTNAVKGQALTGSNAWSVSLRKAWGYIISTRLQYMRGGAHGFNWQGSQGYWSHGSNPYMLNYGSATTAPVVYYNYKTNISEISAQMVAALNNIKFHRARNKMSTYGAFGIGYMGYKTMNDMKVGNATTGTNYSWVTIPAYTGGVNGVNPLWINGYKTERKVINTALKAMYDGDYETPAERHDNRIQSKQRTNRPIATTALGMTFRLGRRFSFGIEDKVTFTMDDLIDGQRWQEWPVPFNGGSAMTRDYDNINYLSANLGVNLGGKSVAPLWWLNPMDFAYNELTNPRRMKVGATEDCATKDADNDGISDCFDKCNDTPLGVAVDSKGCCLDTDYDGVCDYKDKQLITPTECQPVDADGIGKCPCNCKEGPIEEKSCGGIMGKTLGFAPGSTKLSGSAMSDLNNIASQLQNNPMCNVIVRGNGEGKQEQQRSWMRANEVVKYLNSKNIDRDRVIFQFGGSGSANTVDVENAPKGMSGGSIPAPPFPNLK
jgi:OmpA-OmpF porin, OOP family